MSAPQMYAPQPQVPEMTAVQPQQMNPMGYNVPPTYYGGDVGTMQAQQRQMMETQYEVQPQQKGKWKSVMLIAAFVIALLAFIGLIILAMVYGFGSHTNSKRPGWTIVNINTKNAILYAGGNDIFTLSSSAGNSVSVSPPTNGITTPYRSRVFIINNTANKYDLNVKNSSNCSMVDTTPTPGVVASKTSAMYYWVSDSDTFVRLE